MYDIEIELENSPGALAAMGEALGKAGVSIEGGGCFAVNGKGIGHFLFEDDSAPKAALENSGIKVIAVKKVLSQKLNQDVPGQLGKITRLMADAGVNIEVMYSDHQNQLILVVDDFEKGTIVSEKWTRDNQK